MSIRIRLIAAGGAVAVAAVTVLAGTAQAAPAKPVGPIGTMHASCGTNPPDKDSGSWLATARSAANERSGSSTSCTIKGVAQTSDRLDYHCYTDGNDGYTWTYLRNDRTGVAGWVRDDLLKDNGSFVYC
jgi:hypothetical protein